jgi:hypothetical protein
MRCRFRAGVHQHLRVFPLSGQIWFNVHERAKRQTAKAGISFWELSNGFASLPQLAAEAQ